jgi:hypothetical protein
VQDDASGAPSPDITLNNIHSNATVASGSATLLTINLIASVTTGTATSSVYTAPMGRTISRARVVYSESDSTSNYITGLLQDGSGATLNTFNTPASSWVYLPANTTTLRVTVTDNNWSGATDTIAVTQVELLGTGAADVVAATIGGTVNMQNNYLGTFPNVSSRVSMSRDTALDLQGFTGVLFDSTWNRGPYKSGTVNNETWSGLVYVTGNITIPAGQTVTVNAGTQVRFVKHDQNADGSGDFTITANGKLDAAGSMSSPVIVGVLAPGTGNGFQKVVLAGGSGNTSTWSNVSIANGKTALELRGASTLNRVTVTGGTDVAISLITANNASLTDVVVSGGFSGVVLNNSDTVTITRPDLRGATRFGLELHTGSTGVIVSRAYLAMNGAGLAVSGGSTVAVDDSTIRDNTGDGVQVVDASPTIQYSLVTYNGGCGFQMWGTGTTTARSNVVKFNNGTGVSAWTAQSGSPTPVFQSNNIFANGVMGSYRATMLNPGITASVTTGTATSTTYTAPANKVIRRVRVSYTESDSTSNYITARLQDGSGNPLSTFNTPTATWVFLPAGTTTVRVTVTDNNWSGATDTVTLTSLELEGQEAAGLEAMISTDTGSTDARFNFWTATITDVPMKVYETRVGSVDYSGYTGAEYPSGTVMQVGPRP